MTARPIVPCPKCRQSLRLPEGAEGRTIKCPACGEVFQPAPVSAPEEAITLPLAEAPEAIRPTRPAAAAKPVGQRPSPAQDEDIPVVEPIEEEIPARVRAASSQGFSFIVAIKRDPRKKLKGSYQGRLTTAGLQLQQGKKEPILLPRGCGAEYLGGNRLSVTVEDVAVEMMVSRRLAGYQNRLARDVATYLNGDLPILPIDNYSLPWYLTTLVLLPLAIPIVTLGGLVPALIGASGAGINAFIAQRENWPLPLRVILAAAVVCLAFLGLIVFIVGLAIWRTGDKVDSSPLIPRQEKIVNRGGDFGPNMPPQARMPLAPPAPKEEVLPPGVRLLARAPDRRPMDQAEGMLLTVVFTRNGAELIAASNTANVYHWEIAGGQLKGKLKLDVPDALTGFDVTPDGKTVAACANTGPTFLFDFPSGQKRATLIDLKNFASWGVAFSPDGQYLASAHGDGKVRLWDTERGTLRKAINAHGNQISSPAFSRDGKYLASASSWTLEAKIWEMPAGAQVAAFDVEKRLGNQGGISGVYALALTPDGAVLASGGTDNVVRLWDARTGRLRTELPQNDIITALVFSPDGRLLASSSRGDSQIRLWDATTGAPRALRQARSVSQVVGARGGGEIAFSPDSKALAVSRDRGVELWDLAQVLQP